MTNKVRRNLGLPSGVVFPFAGEQAPFGYLICDGRPVSRSEYASLFMNIGTTHGVGDGSTTFNLPDYRGNFLRGRVNINTITGSGTAASNQATFTNHGINRTGFRVRLSSGTLSGLTTSTNYYAIVVNENTLAFATSMANALANTRIAISGTNTAVIAQWEDPEATSRTAGTVGGGAGNSIGAMQEDAFGSHSHAQRLNGLDGDQSGGHAAGTAFGGGNRPTSPSVSTDPSGNMETRPKNSLVNYIIKI